ncbi:hypothetical protein CTI12_AA330590 [Artemisia annua]|uniref:TSL-kinase interacting protein 1 n=1 Tax=Artemisia annua TaxID=35608 RepID=A0A2U1MXJ6_ARTAN|nr:hypothetical protein CTI12_AA330590 [Artemisia annua]
MKRDVQRKGNIAQAPARLSVGTSKVKKGPTKQKGSAPKEASDVLSRQLSESKLPIGTRKDVTTLQLKSGELDPLTKIKLQLFPVDEVTRIRLIKDGLNPFLELTLKARKKISSVIKHIHTKWGASSIATGEPMLLPYDAHLRYPTMSRRWTSKDTVISAGDVYTAVGSPAIFRLSYGWFSDHEPERVSSAAGLHNCIKSESTQKQIETTEERNGLDATTKATDTQVNKSRSHEWAVTPQEDGNTNLSRGRLLSGPSELVRISNNELISSDISIGGLLSEASLQGKLHNNGDMVTNGRIMGHQETPIRWDDSLTALSIGGLLSEVSMQAKFNKSGPKSSERDVMGHPSTLNSDSFDAMIASQLKSNPHVSKPSSLECRSSILDAEETCHAFALKKFASSNKSVRVTAIANQDLSSDSFRFPALREIDKQAVLAEDTSGQEPKMELFPRPQQFGEDNRSLGLRGITWNESLGPFDLGNSMAWMVSDVGNI